MIFEHLVKVAGILDSVNTLPAQQAAEGIDAVLGLYAQAAKVKDSKEDKALKANVTMVVKKIDRPLANALHSLRKVTKECSNSTAPCAHALHRGMAARASELENLILSLREHCTDGGFLSNAEMLALKDLTKVAEFFDEEGLGDAANILDTIVREAADLPNYPSRGVTREEPYDSAKHNEESMYAITRREVADNRKQHHLEAHRPGDSVSSGDPWGSHDAPI